MGTKYLRSTRKVSTIEKRRIHKQPEESGIYQGGALNLCQAQPAPKQLNLESLAMQAGHKSQWLSDAGRNRFFRLFVYRSKCMNILQRFVGFL